MSADLKRGEMGSSDPYFVWLASYPKSGNTWLRLILEAYYNGGELASISDRMKESGMYGSRTVLNEFLGFETSDLSEKQLYYFRDKAYRWFAERKTIPRFIKVHEAFYGNGRSQAILPLSITKQIVYLVRNPLDVLPSFAHYGGATLEKSCAWLNEDEFTLSREKNGYSVQMPQWLLSWSEHVKSWTEQKDCPVVVIRYEDMVAAPYEAFSKVITACDGMVDEGRLRQSIENCRFERVCKLEADGGFSEAPSSERSFFRKGKVGGWRESLPEAIVTKVTEKHAEVMARFDYL